MHLSLSKAKDLLKDAPSQFINLFEHVSLTIELYQPDKIDLQQPHEKDEVYIIASGSGTFYNNGVSVKFNAGDFLFVPAGVEHRFENFTDDFTTWVVFYGPIGGEKI